MFNINPLMFPSDILFIYVQVAEMRRPFAGLQREIKRRNTDIYEKLMAEDMVNQADTETRMFWGLYRHSLYMLKDNSKPYTWNIKCRVWLSILHFSRCVKDFDTTSQEVAQFTDVAWLETPLGCIRCWFINDCMMNNENAFYSVFAMCFR